MTGRIELSCDLQADEDLVWSAMLQPGTFLYVARGLLGFPAVAGRRDGFREGEVATGWLWLFHVLPLHRHTLRVVLVDPVRRVIATQERGGVLRRWDHELRVTALRPGWSRYSDNVRVDAGALTGPVTVVARLFFRYRQRRWRRLTRQVLSGR